MPFGQPAGPPASHSQMKQLLELLNAAGHTDFRDARGPMQFNQRQAGGKFTRQEAEDFIAQLEAEAELNIETPPEVVVARSIKPAPRTTSAEKTVRDLPDSVLAAELQRRGWIVVEP